MAALHLLSAIHSASSSAVPVTQVTWKKIKHVLPFVPSLSTHIAHKGQHGRVVVVGGSESYTGAPYFAAQSSLLFGADLASIYCAKDAAIPIKSYSPDIMVSSVYRHEEVNNITCQEDLETISNRTAEVIISTFSRTHVLVVGPGLGRSPFLSQVLAKLINAARLYNKPTVLDADALFLVSSQLHLIRGYKMCILTPNMNELNMLSKAAIDLVVESTIVGVNAEVEFNSSKLTADLSQTTDTELRLTALSIVLDGVVIIVKGQVDLIASGDHRVFAVGVSEDYGISPRRCGGQGDILAGCIGTAVHWATLAALVENKDSSIDQIYDNSYADLRNHPIVLAAVLASSVVKAAAWRAFLVSSRSTTSTAILNHIGQAFEIVHPDEKTF